MPRGIANNRPEQHPPLREAVHQEPRLRRTSQSAASILNIDPSIIPVDYSYNLKRHSVYGAPDNMHQITMTNNHWQPVMAERHPELVPSGYTGPIMFGGDMLMERPAYLTEEAHKEYIDEAREAGSLQGTENRVSANVQAPRTRSSVQKSVEAVSITDD